MIDRGHDLPITKQALRQRRAHPHRGPSHGDCWTNDLDWGVLLTWGSPAAACGIAERRPRGCSAAHLLTRDEARASPHIAKLPELLSKPQTSIDPLPL